MRIYAGEDDQPWMDRAALLLRIYRDFPGVDFVEVRRGHQIWMVPRGELREADRRRIRVAKGPPGRSLRALARRAYLSGFLISLAAEGVLLILAPDRLSLLGPASAALAIFNGLVSVWAMILRAGEQGHGGLKLG